MNARVKPGNSEIECVDLPSSFFSVHVLSGAQLVSLGIYFNQSHRVNILALNCPRNFARPFPHSDTRPTIPAKGFLPYIQTGQSGQTCHTASERSRSVTVSIAPQRQYMSSWITSSYEIH